MENGTDDSNEHRDREAEVRDTNDGAIIRSRGSSKHVSMAIKQGKKGINQDAMTVWEVIVLIFLHFLKLSPSPLWQAGNMIKKI